MTAKGTVILFLSTLAAGAAIGSYLTHKQVQLKEVERVVTKDRIITVTHTEERPDGTKVTDTTSTETSTQKDSKSLSADPAIKPKWHLSADANVGLQQQPFYGMQLEHQFIGPLSLGVRGDTRGTIGVVVGYSF